MSKVITVITTLMIAIVFVICGILTMKSIPKTGDMENIIRQQENCEHEWVITSKYDFMRESYKTISKCSKCGKEI